MVWRWPRIEPDGSASALAKIWTARPKNQFGVFWGNFNNGFFQGVAIEDPEDSPAELPPATARPVATGELNK